MRDELLLLLLLMLCMLLVLRGRVGGWRGGAGAPREGEADGVEDAGLA